MLKITSNTEIDTEARVTKKLNIGTIVHWSHTYNSCHNSFGRVVSRTSKTVKMVRLGKKLVSGNWMYGAVMPVLDSNEGEMNKSFRIKTGSNGDEYIKVDNYSIGVVWDGKEKDEYCD